MTFYEKLDSAMVRNDSLLCVGLDSEFDKVQERIPSIMKGMNPKEKRMLARHGDLQMMYLFNKWVIEATKDHVCSYKLNTAFYEAIGSAGIMQLKQTTDYLRDNYPWIPIIIDAKRGDIGNTNNGYVQFVFKNLGADAVTVNPYLGSDAIRPFLDMKDKGIIILCRTSNPGSGEFQDLVSDGKKLYQKIAENVTREWNKNKNCLLVVGATYPNEIGEIRKIAGDDMFFLVPGVGTQGGDLKRTLRFGLNSRKSGLIINSSRGIIFAENPHFEAQKLKMEINKIRV